MGKIRLFKASFYYEQFINYKYQKNPELLTSKYEAIHKSFMNERFGWSDYWKKHLEKLGDYEVIEVISNNQILQKTWAKENEIEYSGANWLHDILTAQIIQFKPDVLFAHDYYTLDAHYRAFIKEKCPSIKIIIAWDGVHYCDLQKYKGVDIMLSCMPHTTEFYKNNKLGSFYFQFCLDEDLVDQIEIKDEPELDVTFIGSIYLYDKGHNYRAKLLHQLAKKFQVNYWIPNLAYSQFLSRSTAKQILTFDFKNLWENFNLCSISKGSLFGLNMYNTFANSKISVNCHIDATGEYAGNFRIPEITATKSCLLNDYKKNINDLFEIDKEIAVFRSVEDAVEKIDFLLKNPEKRKSIAENGHLKTLTKYRYENRMKEFSTYLKTFL